MRVRLPLIIVLLVYCGLGVLFAARTPAWQTPDEPAHYNYIRQVAAALTGAPDGALMPVIAAGDWDNAYLETLKSGRFAPSLLDRLTSIEYEDHQPPLYYWLSAPVYVLTNGSLLALRLVSVAWGLVALVITYNIARLVMPQRTPVALATTALIAFLPQQLMIFSSVNNDALALAVLAALLYACLRYRLVGDVSPWWLGLLLGIVILTKATIYFMAAVVLLAVVLRWLAIRNAQPHPLWRPLLMIAVVAGMFALALWGRNISVYGIPDFLGLRAHDAVVVGQLRTSDLIAQVGIMEYVARAVSTTFQSYWGQFGWMAVPMIGIFAAGDALPYLFVGALLLAALVGLVFLRPGATPYFTAPLLPVADQRDAWRILLTVLGLSLLVFAYYNTQFVQFQGRYLFSGLIPFELAIAVGVDALVCALRRPWAAVGVMALFVLLDIILIWRVIPGALA